MYRVADTAPDDTTLPRDVYVSTWGTHPNSCRPSNRLMARSCSPAKHSAAMTSLKKNMDGHMRRARTVCRHAVTLSASPQWPTSLAIAPNVRSDTCSLPVLRAPGFSASFAPLWWWALPAPWAAAAALLPSPLGSKPYV